MCQLAPSRLSLMISRRAESWWRREGGEGEGEGARQGQAGGGGGGEEEDGEEGHGGSFNSRLFDGVAGEVAEGELEDASRRVAAARAAADAEQAERAARDSAVAAAAAVSSM